MSVSLDEDKPRPERFDGSDPASYKRWRRKAELMLMALPSTMAKEKWGPKLCEYLGGEAEEVVEGIAVSKLIKAKDIRFNEILPGTREELLSLSQISDSLNSYARMVDDALEGAEPSWAFLRQTMEQALQSEFPKKRSEHRHYTESLWTYRRTLRSLPEVLLVLADLHKQLKQRLVWRTWAAVARQSAAARQAKRRKFEQRQQLIDEQLAQAEAKSSKDGSHSLYKVIRSFKTGKPHERVQLRDGQGPEALQHIAQLLNRETQENTKKLDVAFDARDVEMKISQTEYAFNPIDGKSFPHHPVMRQAAVGPYLVERGILTELNGLRVPVHFDCENLCNVSQWESKSRGPSRCPYGTYRYYHYFPSRWHACHEHEAFLKSGFSHVHLHLPVVDEEYSEMVAVYQSALRARISFNIMELGARWAPWATRAIALLRLRNPLPYQLLAVEPGRVECAGTHRVLKLNGMHGRVLCTEADAALFLRLVSSIDHLDLLHIDIQGEEQQLLKDPEVLDVLGDPGAWCALASFVICPSAL
ncbi:hypothetical protein AK812_SmicGene17808 [Symbiodinium microadriaticum]|uniref:Methyltransferase FkbM domain-containing protein n=1 Tax=Symbiodinium microadriaticum TaxID=2951 RepID=A0A1Q9DWT7_SYMMI|nr:hypothetical protein AK812_SmicGene17808 [Symbiodinium microadriaticum]